MSRDTQPGLDFLTPNFHIDFLTPYFNTELGKQNIRLLTDLYYGTQIFHKDDVYTLGIPHQGKKMAVSCIATRRENLNPSELAMFLRQRLASYKVPKQFIF